MIKSVKPAWVRYVLSSLIFACVASCENPFESVNPGADQGSLKIEIGLEMQIFTANARVQEVNTDDFLVEIKNTDDESILSFERAADMPLSIPIDPGNYYVEIQSPNDVLPAFDNPKYAGISEVFMITSNQETAVDVTASLANCLVSVVYSSNVVNYFSDYYTVISNSQGSVTFASDETRMGYFGLDPINIESHLSFLNGSGGLETKIISGGIPSPLPQTHYEIHVDATLDQGSVAISILVDETVLTEIVQINESGGGIAEGEIPFGDLLITEIMYNPTAISDTEGEWLEIYNTSSQSIDIFQLVLIKGTEVQHIVSENILIAPQQHLVLARHLNATNALSYVYGSDLTLTNTGDDLVLANYGTDGTDGQVIARVNYGDAGFPDGSGASISLNPASYEVNQAQLGENWCVSTLPFDTGDLGTPGILNEDCNP